MSFYCLALQNCSIPAWKFKNTNKKTTPSYQDSYDLSSRECKRSVMLVKCSSLNKEGHHNAKKQPANAVTFSSMISTDVPLHEPDGVSFSEYINNKSRIFEAMFPDKSRSQRLNAEEWRIQMLPIRFFFASVNPTVDMRLRCKSDGVDYPLTVPLHVNRILELQVTRWKLKGLEGLWMPSHFELKVNGVLYSIRRGNRSRLKGHLHMSITLVIPPALALVPMDVLKAVADAVLTGLVEKMKREVDASLLSDFSKYRKERILAATTTTELQLEDI